MCDKSRNTWLCVHWQWNTLEWCQLNALQASPVVHLVTPLSCVSLSMNTQPSVPAIDWWCLMMLKGVSFGACHFIHVSQYTAFDKSNGHILRHKNQHALIQLQFWSIYEMYVSSHFLCKIYWLFALTHYAPGSKGDVLFLISWTFGHHC